MDEWTVLTFIEQYWYENQRLPEVKEISEALSYPVADLNALLARKDFKTKLENRGIRAEDHQHAEVLSATQLAVANKLMDFTDRRPTGKKLGDMGVSMSQYQAWLRMPKFQRYLRGRAEGLLGDSKHLAYNALVTALDRGDMNAVKTYLELTGELTRGGESEKNYQLFIVYLLEILKKHITDPEILTAVGSDILALDARLREETAGQRPAIVQQPRSYPMGEGGQKPRILSL